MKNKILALVLSCILSLRTSASGRETGLFMQPDFSSSGIPASGTAGYNALVDIYRRAAQRLDAIILNPPGGTVRSQQFNISRAAVQRPCSRSFRCTPRKC